MMTFIVFLNWTEQGRQAFKDIEKRKRYQTAKSLVGKMGGRIVSAYVTTDQYDLIVTLEMPNEDAVTKYVLGAGAAGYVRTTTVRAFTIDAFAQIAADTPAFKAGCSQGASSQGICQSSKEGDLHADRISKGTNRNATGTALPLSWMGKTLKAQTAEDWVAAITEIARLYHGTSLNPHARMISIGEGVGTNA
jgi:uncharacterized protein with GYD domain